MLRLLAAKFSKSARVPADKVECMLADTDNVDPSTNIILITRNKIYFLISLQPNISDKQNSTKSQSFNIKGK